MHASTAAGFITERISTTCRSSPAILDPTITSLFETQLQGHTHRCTHSTPHTHCVLSLSLKLLRTLAGAHSLLHSLCELAQHCTHCVRSLSLELLHTLTGAHSLLHSLCSLTAHRTLTACYRCVSNCCTHLQVHIHFCTHCVIVVSQTVALTVCTHCTLRTHCVLSLCLNLLRTPAGAHSL